MKTLPPFPYPSLPHQSPYAPVTDPEPLAQLLGCRSRLVERGHLIRRTRSQCVLELPAGTRAAHHPGIFLGLRLLLSDRLHDPSKVKQQLRRVRVVQQHVHQIAKLNRPSGRFIIYLMSSIRIGIGYAHTRFRQNYVNPQ